MLDSALYAKMKTVAELLEDTDNSSQLGADENAAEGQQGVTQELKELND